MFVQKQRELPYIGLFKLNSGEEFIATVVEETMGSFTVSKPLCIVPTERGMSFAPLFMFADQEATMTIPKPVITASLAATIQSQYEAAINPSKIAVPKKQAIITP